MTTHIPSSTSDRAKGAYRATSHLEGESSFEFIASAITREVARREKLYGLPASIEDVRTPMGPPEAAPNGVVKNNSAAVAAKGKRRRSKGR